MGRHDKSASERQIMGMLSNLLTDQLARAIAGRMSADDVLIERVVDHLIVCLEVIIPAELIEELRTSSALRTVTRAAVVGALQQLQIDGGLSGR